MRKMDWLFKKSRRRDCEYRDDEFSVRIEATVREAVSARVSQVVIDLEVAFQALGYGYVIARLAGVEVVPETERQAAIAGLHEMGYDTEVSDNRKKVRQKRSVGVPIPNVETARIQSPRMASLVRAAHGERQCLEILAKSKDY